MASDTTASRNGRPFRGSKLWDRTSTAACSQQSAANYTHVSEPYTRLMCNEKPTPECLAGNHTKQHMRCPADQNQAAQHTLQELYANCTATSRTHQPPQATISGAACNGKQRTSVRLRPAGRCCCEETQGRTSRVRCKAAQPASALPATSSLPLGWWPSSTAPRRWCEPPSQGP